MEYFCRADCDLMDASDVYDSADARCCSCRCDCLKVGVNSSGWWHIQVVVYGFRSVTILLVFAINDFTQMHVLYMIGDRQEYLLFPCMYQKDGKYFAKLRKLGSDVQL